MGSPIQGLNYKLEKLTRVNIKKKNNQNNIVLTKTNQWFYLN
jgi:hypothetical protein